MPNDSVALEVSVWFRYTNELPKYTSVFWLIVKDDSRQLKFAEERRNKEKEKGTRRGKCGQTVIQWSTVCGKYGVSMVVVIPGRRTKG